MLNKRKVGVVMPADNAAATLERTFAELDLSVVDEVVLVDDCSTDQTILLARELGLDPGGIVKLASNENPFGPSPRAVAAAQRALLQGQLLSLIHI